MRPQRRRGKKVYCAGPLFNEAEKVEMEAIANGLEAASYRTFLPQRDGLELATVAETIMKRSGLDRNSVTSILSRAIFSLDVYQVADCEGLVLNMNGRVPDEGAMVEAGIAWAHNKKIVIFKNDARTLMNGTDNPLVLGLSNFVTAQSQDDIVAQFDRLFGEELEHSETPELRIPAFQVMKDKGKKIWAHLQNGAEPEVLCDLLISLFAGNPKANEQSSRTRHAV
ncbi:MAG TPA: nucleoside 2-deoxyribosyltransferase [Candidatus Hydrogenedentes bacterium]|nr:nucleoside 2-deoxyribosyltransferase [Candidatus Hydrogenedentota bacterium]